MYCWNDDIRYWYKEDPIRIYLNIVKLHNNICSLVKYLKAVDRKHE